MQSLPRELVHEIISYIPISDLPAFRLAHTSFAHLSREFIFRSILIETTHAGISRRLSVLPDTKIAKHIQELIFIGPRPKASKAVTESSDIYHLKQATWLQKYDGPFQESVEFTEMLAAIFRSLPKLRSIRIRDYMPSAGTRLPRSQIYSRHADAMDWFIGSTIKQTRDKYHLNVFTAVVNAAFEVEIPLCEFRFCGMIDHGILGDTETLQRAAKVFSGCDTLELSFAIDQKREVPSVWRYENMVCAAISPALRLKRLRLNFDVVPWGRGASLPLSMLLGKDNVVWPCLKEVQLVMVDMHDYELLNFLKRHAATLEIFLVKDTMLHSGRWVDVARKLKGEMAVLKKFVLVDEVWDPVWWYKYSQEDLVEIGEYVLGNWESLPEAEHDALAVSVIFNEAFCAEGITFPYTSC